MVNRLRLNEKAVREAEPAEGRDYQIFDTDVRGFAVCIYRSGSRAFTLDYRHARAAAADDHRALAGMVDDGGAGTGEGAAARDRCRRRSAGQRNRAARRRSFRI